MIKRFILTAVLFILCPAGYSLAQPSESDETPHAPAVTPGVNDVVAFNEAVALASKEKSCEDVYLKINAIPDELVERVAIVIATITDYEVSKNDVLKVQSYASEAAERAAQCPAILDVYKNVALKAHNLKLRNI